MSSMYENFKEWLVENNFVLITTLSELKELKKVVFKCCNNHVNTFTINSFKNKKVKMTKENKPELMCNQCIVDQKNIEIFNIEKEKILQLNGHELIEIISKQDVRYKCKNCREIRKCSLSNLHSNKGSCPNCQNWQFKNSLEDVNERLSKVNVTLISYKDNKNVDVLCACGKKFVTSLFDIKRGRLCINCKLDRSKTTCIEKYGVENPFQAEVFKQKIKETCLIKYGYEHHLQHPDIMSKLKLTNKNKYGVEFVYFTKESIRRQKEAMMNKYGVEYPLQSSFIMAKIRNTFLRTIGYEYPLLNPSIQKMCKEKSDKAIMDKYGVDSFFKTENYKKIIFDKYGVDHVMQNKYIFSKMQKSSFTRKKYVFPNGRISYILGYEPECVDELLKTYEQNEIVVETVDIPVINYIKQIDASKNNIVKLERKAVYYPDILLPDKLVEVKSTYTYEKDKENNIRKFKACVEQGYDIEVWIYKSKNVLHEKHFYTKQGIDVKRY